MNERKAIYTLVLAGHTVSCNASFSIFNAGHDVFVVKDFLNGKTYNFPSRLKDAINKYFALILERERDKEKENACNNQS